MVAAPSSSTTPKTTGGAADPGAAERAAAAKRAADAKRAREKAAADAEKARQEAEAAKERSAKAHAAAKAKAETAKPKVEAADRASNKVQANAKYFHDNARDMSPESRADFQKKMDADRKAATRLRDEAQPFVDAASKARDKAISEGNAALEAQRVANTKAVEAKQDRPFPQADRVVDVMDAGSLDQAAQKKLLGATAMVTPQEAADSDAKRIAAAADRGPAEGAEALEVAMREGTDPAYRQALVSATDDTVRRISGQLNGTSLENGPFEAPVSDDVRDRTLGALARAGKHGGPDATTSISEAVADTVGTGSMSPEMVASLGRVSKTPGGAELAAGMADRLTADGKYEAAEQITNASPEIQRLTQIDPGEAAARDAVDVDGDALNTEKGTLDTERERIRDETRTEVDRVFDQAAGPKKPNTETSIDGDTATITTRDARGNVVSRETATRHGEDEVEYEKVEFKNGKATRESAVAGEDATQASVTTWNQKPSKDPIVPTEWELLSRAEAGEEGVRHDTTTITNDDGKVTRQQSAFDHEGRRDTTSIYGTQTDGDGIHSVPEGDFDTDATIHTQETRETTQAWGEDEKTTKAWTYEQGDVRATAVDDESDEIPKQWKLEKQEGNVYKSQTFVEGNEDFTTVVERTAEGRTVTETSKTTGKDEDDDSFEATSESRTEFDAAGRIERQEIDSVDPEGNRTEFDFTRTAERTKDGVQVRELSNTVTTSADGEVSEAQRTKDTLEGPNGEVKVTLLQTRVRGPGGEATSSYTEKGGQQLTVNGKPVPLATDSKELQALGAEEKELAAQAATDVLKTTKDLADRGQNVFDIGRGSTSVGAGSLNGARPSSLNLRLVANQVRLEDRFGQAKIDDISNKITVGASGVKVGMGGLSALASGASLINNIQEHNWVKASADAGNIAVGGANVVAGAKEINHLRTATGASRLDDLSSASGKFGKFAKFGGLGLGVAAGGIQIYDGIKKGDGSTIAQGGVGIAGTVGAFAAGGAIGGPAGVLVGAGIGVLTFGAQWAIGKIWGDDEPKVAEKVI